MEWKYLFFLTFLALIFSIISFFKPYKNAKLKIYIAYIILIIFSVTMCFLLCLGVLNYINSVKVTSENAVFDFFTITLSITGLSISMISIITALLNINREKKVNKYLEDLENKNKEINNNIQTLYEMIDLLNIYTLKDEEFFSLKENALFKLCNKKQHLIMNILLIEFYYNNAQRLQDNSKCIVLYNKIIEIYISIKDSIENDIHRYILFHKLGDTYYNLALFSSNFSHEKAIQYFDNAAEFYNKSLKLKISSTDEMYGYIQFMLGLIHYQCYKITFPRRYYDIEQAQKYLENAINVNGNISNYYIIYAKILVKISKDKEFPANTKKAYETLNQAFKVYEKAKNIAPKDGMIYANYALAHIQKIKFILNIEHSYEILSKYSKKINVACIEKNKDRLCAEFKEIDRLLDISCDLNPRHAANYSYRARMYTFKILCLRILRRKTAKFETLVEKWFEESLNIEPNNIWTLVYQRSYYEMIGKLHIASEINKKINIIDSNFSDVWLTKLNEQDRRNK